MGLLKELLSSKKAMATVTAVIVYAAGHWGFQVDTAILDRIAAALMVFVGGQGLADVGKSAALISAKAAPADKAAA